MTDRAILYYTFDGKPKFSASYSARQTFKFCKRLFKLSRVDGWAAKVNRASFEFGKVVESAVQFHIQNEHTGGSLKFQELWQQIKTENLHGFSTWEYTALEESWENLWHVGTEFLQIFEIRLPSLPIDDNPKLPRLHTKPAFQVELTKEIFPNTTLKGLTNRAFLDILAHVNPEHPLLTPTQVGFAYPPGGRAVIIDVKTSARDLNTALISLDPQLLDYAWQRASYDVAFLWFAKKNRGIERGSHVTLLDRLQDYPAGFELLVIGVDDTGVWVGKQETMDAYDRATCLPGTEQRRTGNDLKLAKAKFFAGWFDGEYTKPVLTPASKVSKQRLQFAATRLDPADITDQGKQVAHTTVEMVMAAKDDWYPKEGSFRFPHDKCSLCSMQPICLGDIARRDETLTRSGEEWLDGEFIPVVGEE